MHEIIDLPDANLAGITLSDTLTEEDYEAFTSVLEDHFESNITTRVMIVMEDVDDWTPEERWEDLAFDIRHLSDVDKVAIVGDDLWERWLDKAEVLFPMSTIQTYEAADQEEAFDWIRGDMDVPGVGPGSSSDPEASFADEEE
ncbi:MAG: STAS/SEC14 domain-containing protein [Salinibacter sp.]|uniref:STAS/SEC14 domain-containing protein n=1 Tax=Salinibacter sp. TaxID=2065818 RepID=UPI002FC2FD66